MRVLILWAVFGMHTFAQVCASPPSTLCSLPPAAPAINVDVVVNYSASPLPGNDDTCAFLRCFADMAGYLPTTPKTVNIPPGQYDFYSPIARVPGAQAKVCALLLGVSNLTVNGNGAVLTSHDRSAAIFIIDGLSPNPTFNSSDITIDNLIIEYCPLNVAQGTVASVAVSTSGLELVLTPDATYPSILSDPFFGMSTVPASANPSCINAPATAYETVTLLQFLAFYGDSRRLKKGNETLYLTQGPPFNSQYELLTGGNIRVCVPRDPAYLVGTDPGLPFYNIQAGDAYAIVAGFGDPFQPSFAAPAIVASRTKNLTLSHITVRSSPGFGFSTSGCMNVTETNCTIAAPPGSQLLATGTDGMFHYGNVGPTTIQQNTFERTLDDSISMFGRGVRVAVAATASNTIIVDGDVANLFGYMQAAGDFSIDVSQSGTQLPLGTFSVAGIAAVTPPSPCVASTGPYSIITLASPQLVSVQCGDTVEFNCARQTGFDISGNIFVNNLRRAVVAQGVGGGAQATAISGTIIGNLIDGSSYGGIHIGTTACVPNGSPLPPYAEDTIASSHQLVIANNYIQECQWAWNKRYFGCSGYDQFMGGAISVTQGHYGSAFPAGQPNTNIAIVSNYIRNVGMAGICTAASSGMFIDSNTCFNTHLLTNSAFGASLGIAQPFVATLIAQDISALTVTSNHCEASVAHPALGIGPNTPSATVMANSTCHATGFEDYEFSSPCFTPSTFGTYPCVARLPVGSFHPVLGGTWSAQIDGLTYQLDAWVLFAAPYSVFTGHQSVAATFDTAKVVISGVSQAATVRLWMAAQSYTNGMSLVVDVRPSGTLTWATAGTIPVSALSGVVPPLGFAPFSVAVGLSSGPYDVRFRISNPGLVPDYIAIDNIQIDY